MRSPYGLFNCPEALHRDYRLIFGLQAPSLPVEAGPLGHIEVRNLHSPAGVSVFARDTASADLPTPPFWLPITMRTGAIPPPFG